MILTIEVMGSASDATDLANLHHVFKTDDALRQTDIRLVSRSGDSEVMGPVTDAVVVALGGGGVGAVLLQTVGEWLRSRKSDVSVRLTTAKATVEISVSSVDAPEKMDKILRKLEIG